MFGGQVKTVLSQATPASHRTRTRLRQTLGAVADVLSALGPTVVLGQLHTIFAEATCTGDRLRTGTLMTFGAIAEVFTTLSHAVIRP
jgi:hypothetical protein